MLTSSNQDELEPWGFTASFEFNAQLSELFQQPLVQFAQAWLKDMVACFVVGNTNEPSVLVVNPWLEIDEMGEPKQWTILEKFSSFSKWVKWVRESELVQLYASVRSERLAAQEDPINKKF